MPLQISDQSICNRLYQKKRRMLKYDFCFVLFVLGYFFLLGSVCVFTFGQFNSILRRGISGVNSAGPFLQLPWEPARNAECPCATRWCRWNAHHFSGSPLDDSTSTTSHVSFPAYRIPYLKIEFYNVLLQCFSAIFTH